MALIIDQFDFNSSGTKGRGGRIHYYTTADAFSTVEADGYFDSIASYSVITGDFLRVWSTTDLHLREYRATVVGTDVALSAPRDVLETTKTITSAQVLALNATPREVIAAQGTNKATIVIGGAIHKPAGTAYAGIAAGEDLVLKFTNASGAECSTQVETTGFLDQTTAQTRAFFGFGDTAAAVNYPVNAAVVLHLLSGEITTGDSNLIVRVRYLVMDAATA